MKSINSVIISYHSLVPREMIHERCMKAERFKSAKFKRFARRYYQVRWTEISSEELNIFLQMDWKIKAVCQRLPLTI